VERIQLRACYLENVLRGPGLGPGTLDSAMGTKLMTDTAAQTDFIELLVPDKKYTFVLQLILTNSSGTYRTPASL
jgi:hypothetical protein